MRCRRATGVAVVALSGAWVALLRRGGPAPRLSPARTTHTSRRATTLVRCTGGGGAVPSPVALPTTMEALGGELTVRLDMIACQAVEAKPNQVLWNRPKLVRRLTTAPAPATLH